MVGAFNPGIHYFLNTLLSAGDVFAYRTFPFAIGVLPSQTIVLARCTNDALRILVYVIDRALLKRIFMLRLHITTADIYGVQLVCADAAIQELLAAGFAVATVVIV